MALTLPLTRTLTLTLTLTPTLSNPLLQGSIIRGHGKTSISAGEVRTPYPCPCPQPYPYSYSYPSPTANVNPSPSPTPTPNQVRKQLRRARKDADVKALVPPNPHIAPTSPLYLACVSPLSRLHLACISPTSPLYLHCISPVSRLHLRHLQAVVLRMDSGGGDAIASDAIHREVLLTLTPTRTVALTLALTRHALPGGLAE